MRRWPFTGHSILQGQTSDGFLPSPSQAVLSHLTSFPFYFENTIFPRNSVRALYQLKNLFYAHQNQHERWYLEAAAVHQKSCIRMEWTDKRALTVRPLWVTALWTCCTHPGVIRSQPWHTRDSSPLEAATAAKGLTQSKGGNMTHCSSVKPVQFLQ